jgi:hypothetical protein
MCVILPRKSLGIHVGQQRYAFRTGWRGGMSCLAPKINLQSLQCERQVSTLVVILSIPVKFLLLESSAHSLASKTRNLRISMKEDAKKKIPN